MRSLTKRFGFAFSLAVTILLSAGLELTGVWWTMLVAGFVGGFLIRKLFKAIAVGFLGVLIGWTLYFLAFWMMAPAAVNLAFSLTSLFVVMTLILGGVLGALSGIIGALASLLIFERVEPVATQ